ncbi:protein of unknown function [Azospirillum baldaniorum]|uniref:Helicase ATP-binding domain-containing protein n=1 Tax=Azospirillum baldaniorum TaxID=1064539 RepID=A0A9P1JSS2_9PROT|nr:protein of unknown function [Azospirillum baldaniorum]
MTGAPAAARNTGGAPLHRFTELMSIPPLPIDPVLPELLAALDGRGVAVLQAPPGAGKTTRVPLALLDRPWLAGRKVIVLEPRRLAARAAARRMAAMLGESVGETVGYRVRLDTKVGPKTRIEVVTDGLFLRQLQEDPELPAVGAVLFDEFHERGIDSDLALALVQEARGALRDDLRLVVMSATLDGGPVAALLGDAPMVTSEGRAFPVETRHLDAPGTGTRIEDAVATAVRRALREESGNALVFLPGAGEIRRVQSLLEGSDLGPGHGDRPALRRPDGGRPGPRHRPKPAGHAQDRPRHPYRRNQPDHRGHPHRRGRRADAGPPLRPAQRHDAAGHRQGLPGVGGAAAGPRRPVGARRLLPPVAGAVAQGAGPFHPAGDHGRRPRPAGAGAGGVGRVRPVVARLARPAARRRHGPGAGAAARAGGAGRRRRHHRPRPPHGRLRRASPAGPHDAEGQGDGAGGAGLRGRRPARRARHRPRPAGLPRRRSAAARGAAARARR